MQSPVSRRQFLKTSAVSGAAMIVAPGLLGASPNEKLNVAVIGCGGRGASNMGDVAGENIVALCDVNDKALEVAAKQFPKAKTHNDWRKCVDQKDIEAVVCSTTDFTHAFVNVWAMNRGKHVYCEKPLANSVEEARKVRETYLKNPKLRTQMGTQIHATDNYRRVVELVKGGAIGKPKEVRVWCGRTPEGGSYLPAVGDPPANLHWDLWSGPSCNHPFNPGYLGGCLAWNRFWDFGSGQIGDMGSHLIDLAYWAYDLRFPTSCEAQGTPVNSDTCPQWLIARWEHPANDWRPAVKVSWHDASQKPDIPKLFAKDELFKGLLFIGDKGQILADYDYRILWPTGDMTEYRSPKAGDLIPASKGHHREWIDACKTGSQTLCNFDYSGALIEHNLLAMVAYRVGKKLEWDAANLKAPNAPEADQFIRKTYREGWKLDG
jgi:predicted dehydrogenase